MILTILGAGLIGLGVGIVGANEKNKRYTTKALEEIVEATTETAKTVNEVKDNIVQKTEDTVEAATETVEKVKDNIVQEAKETVEAATETAEETAKKVKDNIVQEAVKAAEEVKDTADFNQPKVQPAVKAKANIADNEEIISSNIKDDTKSIEKIEVKKVNEPFRKKSENVLSEKEAEEILAQMCKEVEAEEEEKERKMAGKAKRRKERSLR